MLLIKHSLNYKKAKIIRNILVMVFNKMKLPNKYNYFFMLSFPGLTNWNPFVSQEIPTIKYWTFDDINSLIEKADNLYDEGNYIEVYELLNKVQYKNNVEIVWRVARTLYKLSTNIMLDSEVRVKMISEAFELIQYALQISDNSASVHKWMAIILNAQCEGEGTVCRVKNSLNTKKHLTRALELDPNDIALLYMLGKWCYDISSLNWFQRYVATILYASPPTSSFEEAFEYFSRAEEISPHFYVGNLLMLGKTSIKLKKLHRARYYLNIAEHLPVYTEEDKLLAAEASRLAKKLQNFDVSQSAL